MAHLGPATKLQLWFRIVRWFLIVRVRTGREPLHVARVLAASLAQSRGVNS